MELSQEFFDFIAQHIHDDVLKLRMKYRGCATFDLDLALAQIEVRQKRGKKLPTWDDNLRLLYPAGITFEQSSSEITARYKQRFHNGDSLCDLTGGLGIDSLYFSKVFKQVTYVERYAHYCTIAQYNHQQLGVDNIEVINRECGELLADTTTCYDTIYLDPARRSEGGNRVFALNDYEPNLELLLPTLLQRSKQIIIKVSPMVDVVQVTTAIPQITRIDILSVKGECKELLLVIQQGVAVTERMICCINYTDGEQYEEYCFKLSDERELKLTNYATHLNYLYEPNASVLKGGAFKQITQDYPVEKLHPHSHLYSSEQLVEDFPGRRFKVVEVLEFSGKLLKQLKKRFPKANIAIRNFPLSVKEIRQKSGIADGGNDYLFATTLSPEQRVVVVCSKL